MRRAPAPLRQAHLSVGHRSMKTTQTITIEVERSVAQAYLAASPAIRAKLDALLNLTLQRAFFETRSLEEVMDELSHNAQARGLTPQILAEILDEESAS